MTSIFVCRFTYYW